MSAPRGLRARAALAGAALALSLALSAGEARAANDPDLAWYTFETTHFRVHYPHTLEPVAARVAALCETVHARLAPRLGYSPRSVTHVVVTDNTDSANGSATALPFNTIRLFVTAPDDLSPLGDYDDWLLDLITHEHTHILHIDNISGAPAVVNAVFGKTYSPNQAQPRWIIEGLAVYHETRGSSAGRLRSSLFDMFLRADVLSGNTATLAQISSNPYRWPQGTVWYLYGSRFIGWISDVYGEDVMRAVSADYGAQLVPWSINRSIRRVTGKTYEELYEGFKDHVRRLYAAQVAAVEERGLREGRRITFTGRQAFYPRFVPRAAGGKGDDIVFYRADQNSTPGIYRMRVPAARVGGGAGDAAGAGAEPELVARTNGHSSPSFTPEGDLVFDSVSIWKVVYARDDLFLLPRGERSPSGEEPRRRLTRGLRASGPDVSPDGSRVAFTVNNKGTTFLELADLGPTGLLENRRTLVPSARFEQAYTPRFSPDGKLVAYSAWTGGGYRDIRVVDVETGAFFHVTRDRALDANPVFSPDGKTLYFTSDRTGIINVYAYELETGELRQVTNVRLGALSPAVSPDGKTLVYVGYTHEGYDLFAMPLDPSRFLPALPPPVDRPDPPTEPSGVELSKRPYEPLHTLAPRNYVVSFGPGAYGGTAFSFSATGSDVVGLHGVGAGLTVEPGAPAPQATLDYAYRRLPFDFGMRVFRTVSPRQNFRIGGQTPLYDELALGGSTSISYSIPSDFASHRVGLSYSASAVDADLPVAPFVDPYATVTQPPNQGLLGLVRVGYSFSNVQGGQLAAGPRMGAAFNLSAHYGGPETASDFTYRALEATLTGYVPMPYPGEHVLALRGSGGIAGGTYARGGIYYVGGYDTENVSLLDTLTTGIYDGAFVLRGYPGRAYVGRQYLLATAEYRAPLVQPDVGPSTLPVYLRRIDGNVFLDYGGAFEELDTRGTRLFQSGALLDVPELHTAIGAETWFGLTLGYYINVQLRLGYAYGFSAAAVPGGKLYLVGAGSF